MTKYLSIILVGTMAVFGAACDSDGGGGGAGGTGGTGGTGGSPGAVDLCADAGGSGQVLIEVEEIDEDTILTPDCTYVLTRLVYVVDAKLTIQAGVQVLGDIGSAMIITRTAEVDAQGTVDNPIVMTSSRPVGNRETGNWGGLALLGNGILNRGLGTCAGTGDCEDTLEGLPAEEGRALFGGDDNSSSCGTVTYTRIEFAGNEVAPNNELNGLTVGGCGSGTTLDYIQVHRGLDDGVEFFGGAANISHVITDGMGDDGVDWDQGYVGTVRNFIVHHYAGRTDDPRGIEADNFSTETSITPRSNPTVEYGTIVADPPDTFVDQGVVLRRGTWGALEGLVVENYANAAGVDIRDDGWVTGWPTDLSVSNSCFWQNNPNYPTDVDCTGGDPPGTEDCNDYSESGDVTDEANYFPENTNMPMQANLEEDPQTGDYSTAATGGMPAPDYSVGNFAPTTGNCMGAFASDVPAMNGVDWTAGWTAYPVN